MSYTKKQVSEISGLSLRLVQFYTEEGLILPEKNTGKGRGNIRQYSKKSLLDFLVIAELENYGVTKSRMVNFLKYIHSEPMVATYSKERFYEKGVRVFLYLNIKKNTKKAVANFKEIAGGKEKTSVLSIDELKDFSSSLVINFEELVKKANQE